MIKDPKKANSDALLKAECIAYYRLKERIKELNWGAVPGDPVYQQLYDDWYKLYVVCDTRGLTFLKRP